MLRKMLLPVCVMLGLFLMAAGPQRASAANVMNYGADGMDYFQFTTPSMAFDKASGFTTLITFAMHVNADGTLLIGGVACTNGVYVGPTNWNSLITTLKTPPTTVTRYEVCIGGWTDTSFDNIKSLVVSQGVGTTSILYKNFQALKNAVPGIDAINDDEEQTYDLGSATNFANMLSGLGYKFTMVPYQNQTFWVNLNNAITNCDYIYLQCYEGGAGNDPGQWNTAFGHGVVVIPGQESNTAQAATNRLWYLETGVQGGFYYPDVVFNSTYWSAAIIEANGAVPAAPIGVAVVQGSRQIGVSWNTVPGAISYNVKRSMSSGGETTIANVSTANNNWPASNQYADTGLTTGTTYYYKVSAVNNNGESVNSAEVSAKPLAASVWTGLGSDNNWGTGGNWNSTPSFPTGLTFAGSTRLTNSNNLSAITVNGITFDAAAGAFVLDGNDITLGGNMAFSGNPASRITQTVNLNMVWSISSLDIDTPANGNLVLGGANTSTADYSLNKTSAGTLTLNGTNFIAGMGVNGGTNIITGNTTINGNGDGNDRIYVGDGDFLNDCIGTLVIQPGATLAVTGAFGDQFVIGRDSGSGTVIQNGGTFTFNPSTMPSGNLRMLVGATGSSATRAEYDMNAGLLNMSGRNLSVGWGNQTGTTGTLNQVGGVITNLNEMEIPTTGGASGMGVYTLSGGSVYLLGGGIINDSSSYRINLGGGTVGAEASWSSSLNMNLTNLNGSVTFDTMANTITLSGALSGNGGLTKVGSGTLILSGTNTYTGNTTVNAGTLQLNLAGTSPGSLYIANGAKLNLDFTGNYVAAHFYTNNVVLPNGIYTSSSLPGFISGPGSLQLVGAFSTGLWTGLGANNNWSASGNWDHNTVPVFPIGLTFAGSKRLVNNNDLTSITASSITFDAAAGAFTLGGNSIGLNGNLGFNGNPAAPVTQAVNLNMAWGADKTIDTPTNGNLALGGAITSGNNLFKIDAGTLTLGGVNTIESMDVNGGTNIIAGNTTLNGNYAGYDRSYVGDGDTIANCSGTLIIQPGAVFSVTGSFNDSFVIGRDSGSGTVIQNGGIFTFNGNQQDLWVGATSNPGTQSEYDMNGGLLNISGNTLGIALGNGVLTTGVVNQVSGFITNVNNLWVGWGSGQGVYTLSGGSIYIGALGITTTSGNYAINLGGGTVGAYQSWASSLNMTLTGSNGPVTFDTAGNNITLSGVLSGNGGLIKASNGTLELSGANSYAGDTTVNVGTLRLDMAGSSHGALHLANGAVLNLNFGGTNIVAGLYTNNVALPTGIYNAGNLPGFITGSGSVQVAGLISAGMWTGGGVNDNWSAGGNWDHNVVPIFPIGLTFAGSTRLANTNDLAGITVHSLTFDAAAGAFVLGGNGITLGGTIGFNGNPAPTVTQTINLNMAFSASQTINTPINGNLMLGGAVTSANDLTKIGAGTLTLGGTNMLESIDVDGGTNIITGNCTINGNSGGGNYGRLYVGDGDSYADCNGTLDIQPGAVLNITGNFNDTCVIGRDGGSGTVIQNGGTFVFNPANISLMLICATDVAGTEAAYDLNGGLLDMSGNSLGVGYAVASAVTTGIVNQVGGIITNLNAFELGPQESGGLGIYTLTGGGLYLGTGGITTAGGNYAINLGGGTVGAYASWASSLSMNLTGSNGPVTFDTAANTITLSGLLYGYGGLTKIGSGTLILSGATSYLGNTTVKAGTLQLNLAGTSPGAFYLTNGASLYLNSGGTYAVGALYTNNIAIPNGIYTSSNLPGFITGTNALQVVSITISYSLSGSNLTLSWPANYLGWILQEQTNSLNVGLNANWVALAGSSNVTSTNIFISLATPTAFFRLSPPPLPSAPPLARQMFITNNLLNLPVNNNGPSRRVTFVVGGIPVRDFDINLADGAPDWWAFVDVSAFQGQTATVNVDNLAVGSTGLSSIVESNGIVGATNLYSESLRPQVHYTSRRGLINDVNGMIYYQGQYNLYYQHNPYSLNFGANGAERNWGHAVSTDMVHWQELPEAIYPHAYGDWVWSGSAVIDTANTGGFRTGTNNVIVDSFYSTARGQCIAYSNDGGLTFIDYTNNPVVTVPGRDPHMLWYAPSNYWVMAVYDSNLGGIDFFTTPDFHIWTYRSGIAGFAECPDIFQLPVDGNTNNMLWEINGGSASYMLGNFNGAVFTPTTAMLPGNLGTGFYASQTFTVMPTGDTRRVRMGWAQVNMAGMPFTGMHFFPTVLTLQTLPAGVKLCAAPIAEITNAIQNNYTWTNLTVIPGYNPLSGIDGQLFDLQAQFTPGSASAIIFNLCGVPISYTPATEQITCNGDTQTLAPLNGTVTLEIITDCQSVEIFGNSGQLYMPIVTTPYSPTNNVLSLTSQGASSVFNSLTINKLNSIW